MELKDIQVGKTYRFAGPEINGYQERGTVVVRSTTNGVGPWSVEGEAIIERRGTDSYPVEVLLYAHELIEEV